MSLYGVTPAFRDVLAQDPIRRKSGYLKSSYWLSCFWAVALLGYVSRALSDMPQTS